MLTLKSSRVLSGSVVASYGSVLSSLAALTESYVHVVVADRSRIAYTIVQDSETDDAAVDHPLAVVRFYRSVASPLGVC